MPRSIPDEFIALEGQKSVYAPVLLMALHLNSGTRYYSSEDEVVWDGQTWEANRLTAPSVTFGIIDAEHREFPKITLKLDNLPDGGSSALPFQEIDATEIFEDKLVVLYVYSPDKETAFEFWRGRALRPAYNGEDKTVDLNLSFIFDSLFLPVPSQGLPQAGFTTLGVETNQDDLNPAAVIPLYYGVGEKKIRPLVYRFENAGAWAYVNFVVSGCAPGLPFGSDDILNLKLFDTIKAQEIIFHPGGTDTAPHNLTKFPDGTAHDNVAYGFALFPWDNREDQSVKPDDVRGTIANGRPLIDTGLPSENLPLIIKDLLRDPTHGLGAPDSDFDNDALADTVDYTGTRYQARLELRDQQPLIDLIQQLLGECHCFIAWPNGQIQIRAKRNDEVATATFATINSGHSGILIEDDIQSVEEKSFDEISNQLKIDFRLANRHKAQPIYIRDRAAQQYAGGNYQKVSQDEVEFAALFDVEQVKKSGAIRLREVLQGNIYVKFRTPFYDSLRVVHGDTIDAFGKDTPNGASNYVFRVLAETWDFGEVPFREFYCKLYKPAIYNDDYAGLEIDLERTGTDTSQSGRPDDVMLVSLAVSDPVEGDTGGKLITVEAECVIPPHDAASEQAEGIFRLPPIAAWQPYCRYDDESVNLWRPGPVIEVAQTDTPFNSKAQFQIDFYRKSIEVQFVALPPSRVKSKLGYIPDPAHATHLTANLSATAASANVDDASVFAGAQYAICEFEIAKITGAGSGTVSFDVDGSGHRQPYFESSAIAHPDGTQIAVAKLSYPSLSISLTPPRFTYPVVQNLAAKQRSDGVRFHWDDPSADNQEKFRLYWSTDSDAGTNPLKLGSANPAWYATDPKTPGAGVNMIVTDAFSALVLQELIGAAGTTVYGRLAAQNGKNNYSEELSALASNKLGDDVVPSVASAPTVVPRQIGLRVKVILPTLNMKTFSTAGKIEVVLLAMDASNAALGYVTESGSTFGTQIGEYKFDVGLNRTPMFNIKRGDLLALFPTISTLRVYCYVSNAVGTSAASPVSSLNVSTWEADAVAQDTAVPTVPAAPTVIPSQAKIKVKTKPPTSQIAILSKVEIVARVKNGSGTVLGYIIDGTTPTNNATEFKNDIGPHFKDTFNWKRSDIVALYPTAATIEFYNYVTNEIGTSAASAATALSVSTWEVDGVAQDTTVPTIPTAPTVIPSQSKIKVKTKPPTSQIAVLVKVEIVARVKNGSGTVLGYIIDGATPTNNATEFKNDNGLHFKDTFNWKKADIIALYPTASTIEFYDYVTNEIGTSAASAATSLNVSTWEVDGVAQDTVVPTIPAAPTVLPSQAKIKVKTKPPTSQIAVLSRVEIVARVKDGGGTVLGYIQDSASGPANSATEFKNDIGPHFKDTFNWKKTDIIAIYTSPATIEFYNYVTNEIGTSAASAAASLNVSTWEVDSVSQDTAVPSSLSVATLVYIPRQGVHIENLRVNANWNTPADKWVVIYNQAGIYFDLPTYLASGGVTVQAASSELVARYRIGPGKNHAPFGIKLHDLKAVFGFTNPTNVYAYFYAANAFGLSSKSVDSAALNLYGAKDIMGASDGVRVLDVAATMMSPGNLLGNGDAILVDATTDEQANWLRWDGLTTPLPAVGGSGLKIITSTSAEIAYVSSTDSLWLKANTTWQLIQNIKKRLKPGTAYTVLFMLRAASAITVSVKLHLYNLVRPALTGTMNLTSSINCVGTGTLAGTEFLVGDQIVASGQKRTVATITDPLHWTVTSAFSAASGAMNVIIDNINHTINQSVALTTSYQIFQAVIRMKQSPNLATSPGGSDYANHRFGLEITGNTQDIYTDYFMMVRGEQQMMFAPRGDENDNVNIGTVPTFVAVPDIIPISGTQGGGFLPDSGGLISLQ